MSSPREIRTQIASIKKIQKITNAMENVAASKMRRAQEHMDTSMPYAIKIREVVRHIANSENVYQHCKTCEIRKCGMSKGIDNCAFCNDYACDKLLDFFKMVPDAKKRLESVRSGIS